MGKHGVFGATRVQLPHLCYLGGETITNPDNWKVPLPTVPTIVQVASEGGGCFYAMNGNFAQHNSPGRIVQDAEQFIGPMSNMETLHIHAPAGIVHLQYWHECGHGRNERAAFQYYERVLNLGPIAYWPLWETSGTTAECLVNPAQNGTYSSDVATWPVGAGIGDGNSAPGLDGTNDYVNAKTATLEAAINGAEGTSAIWLRVPAAAWTDGAFRNALNFSDDPNNVFSVVKTNAANTLVGEHIGGGTAENHTEAGITSTDWLHYAMTWSEADDEVKYYLNGLLLATDTTIGTWNGDSSWTSMVIGALLAVPVSPWLGWLAHAALWDRALTQPDINSLAAA